jgi:hypothetical protein
MKRNTGGKITTFKPGHPVLDGGIQWYISPLYLPQNGVIFFRRLALQEKKNLTAPFLMFLKSRALFDVIRFRLFKRKDLKFGT